MKHRYELIIPVMPIVSVCNSSSVQSQGTLSCLKMSESSSAVQSEVLVLPKPKESVKKRKRKEALNKKAVCITDIEVLVCVLCLLQL